MKKILSCVMALSIAACAAMSASATELNTGATTGTHKINYTSQPQYTIEIPDGPTDITSGSASLTVTASDVLLNDGQTLSLKVASANDWTLKCGTSSIEYDVKIDGTSIKTSGEVMKGIDANTSVDDLTEDIALEVGSMDSAKCAGTYSDTLTFTATVD